MPEFRPTVLSISGHDPSGGAGIQADIETLLALDCYPSTVVTALTLQDTRNIKKIFPQPGRRIDAQLRLLSSDLEIRCIKIGLVGSIETVSVVSAFLREQAGIPVVLDPVLAAGGGFDFSDQDLVSAIATGLIPLSTVITPNQAEARRLSPAGLEAERCGDFLNSLGCGHVLITRGDRDTEEVVNTLYRPREPAHSFSWKRLGGTFHGSGCTLASAVAAFLAHGLEPFSAISEAQQFAWDTLNAGFKPGKGQAVPDRLVRFRTR